MTASDLAVVADVDDVRAAWAARIAGAWRKSVEAVLEAGRLLTEAKAALPHGAFLGMIESDLPFKRSTAFRLMAIAADPRLANGAHGQHLPQSWRTLYELTKLSDETFDAKLSAGEIHPEMLRRHVARENWLSAKARDEERVKALEPTPGRCRTLVIDPPYDYGWNSPTGNHVGPGYAVMSQAELLALPVETWAEDESHLYLCTTNHFMDRAFALMAAWGFTHKATLTWIKPNGQPGSYFFNTTEHTLFGVRGGLLTKLNTIPTHFEAPRGSSHSEKPERLYEIVRAASYPPYREVFQRQARPDFANLFREAAEREAAEDDSEESGHGGA
jgi:N6-adenosine-specific RNA methylase IME4